MEYHLIILVHGLWGNVSHFNYIKSQLEQTYKTEEDQKEVISVYKTGSNEGYKTYDGVDICGKRVAQEIEMEIKRLNESGGTVTKISVVGYSLGGLVARYAIGILYYKGYFNEIAPINFTTFCTPHVGVLTPGKSISIRFFNWLVPFLLANTGKQMFLKDKAKFLSNSNTTPAISRASSTASLLDLKKQQAAENQQPLLALMANPASIFYKSLKLFKYKSLYSNVVNDKRTSWWTAGISMINPFEALDVNPNIKIDLNGVMDFHNGNKFRMAYLDNYSPIIVDASKPLKILSHGLSTEGDGAANPLLQNIPTVGSKKESIADREKVIATDYAENFFKRKFKWVLVIFNIVIYAPMWVLWFILTNLIERFKSGVRVLKESDAGSFLELYQLVDDDEEIEDTKRLTRRPSFSRTLSETYDTLENKFEQNLQDQTEELMESVWDAMMSKKIHNEEDFFWFNEKVTENKEFEKEEKEDGVECYNTSIEELADYKFDDEVKDKSQISETISNILENFKLNFNNKAQIDIIRNLNMLKWKKFPIYIQLTTTTHAASIVRHQDGNFKEGEVVVRHFCDDIFKLN